MNFPFLRILVASFLLALSVQATPPPAPANVEVVYLPAEILLRWDASEGANHYRVDRGGPSRRWAPLPSVTDPWIRDGDYFSPIPGYYLIAAVNAAGELSTSVEVFVDVPPLSFPRPAGVSVRQTSDATVAVMWSSADVGLDGTLEIGTSLDDLRVVAKGPSQVLPFAFSRFDFEATGLAPNHLYVYRITSVGANHTGFSYWNRFRTQSVFPTPPVLVSLTDPDPSLSTAEDIPVTFTLVATGAGGAPLPASVTDAPFGLLFGLAPNYTYVSNPEHSGLDYLDCAYTDGITITPVRVFVNVEPVLDPPIALDRTVNISEDQRLKFPVQVGGGDYFPSLVDCQIVSEPTNGTVTKVFTEQMTVEYIPNPNFNGIDHFTFRCSDGVSTGNVATVRIYLAPVNDPPAISDQTITVTRGIPSLVHVEAVDPDGDEVLFSLVSNPLSGTLTSLSSPNKSGDFRYTPVIPTNNVDNFTVRVSDGLNSSTAVVTLHIDPPYFSPVAQDLAVTTESNVAVAFTLTGTASAGQTVSFLVRSLPAHGTLSGIEPNLIYTPAVGVVGSDSFLFQVKDTYSFGSTGTVRITVAPPTLPNAPGELSGVVAGTAVSLSWVDQSANETRFEVERSMEKSAWKPLATVEKNITTFVDNAVMKNKTYLYRVRAANSVGNSAFSNTTTVTIPK
jgi:hypothetical protein